MTIIVIQTLDHRHQTLDLGEGKELGYLDTDRYRELWAKAKASLRMLQGLISYIEKSGI